MGDDWTRGLSAAGLSPAQVVVKREMLGRARRALEDVGLESGAEVRAFFVPGRVEVLGKHTDYAGGRSLLCTVERGFGVVAAPREDRAIRVIDAGKGVAAEFALDPDLVPEVGQWSNYPMTVARRLARNFPGAARGADIAFVSDLPADAGMSSSSAFMIAIFLVLAELNALGRTFAYRREIRSAEDLAGYLGTVENGQSFGSLAGDRGVGTFGGSEDHTAILCCQPGALSQYSFCPVRHERTVPLPDRYVFVVGSSGVLAQKTGDALEGYNRASLATRAILESWRVSSGRADASLAAAVAHAPDAVNQIRRALAECREPAFPRQVLLDRLQQFVDESTEIVPAVGDAIARGDVEAIGPLVERSQRAAEVLLGNQVPETIALARMARSLGAVAASAFGAGFGGSVWALVNTEAAGEFQSRWSEQYARQFPDAASRAISFVTRPGPAAIRL
jgi:galactokinase